MESDLALTAHHMGTERSCLAHVDAAEKSPYFATAGAAVRKALAANRAACSAALAKGPAPYDFSWLREYAAYGVDPHRPPFPRKLPAS